MICLFILLYRDLSTIVTVLDMSAIELEEIPLSVCNCRFLEELRVARNEITGK